MTTEIICLGCRTVGAVNRVTANLRCSCGSTDLDLYEPVEQGALPFLAAMGVQANSGGTGWGQPHPDELKGWSQYPGPMPGANPFTAPKGPDECPQCHGSGWSLQEKCRACFGTGHRTPTTSVHPAPQVARHPGQTKIPFVGHRRQSGRTSADPLGSPEEHIRATTPGYTNQGMQGPDEHGMYPRFPNVSPHVKTRPERDYTTPAKPLTLDAAPCPECGHAPTQLVKDSQEDGWWHCPNCGPLTNIDKHPEVDPFNPEQYAGRDSTFKSAGRRRVASTGRVLRMCAAVATTNPGMTAREVLTLVRRTVQRYSE